MGIHTFFWVTGIVGVGMGLAIAASPIGWARVFGWPLTPADQVDQRERHLCLYFGRCLGAMVLAFAVGAIHCALQAQPSRSFLLFTVCFGAGLTGVHVYGAIRGIQPIIETIEIAIYGGLTVWGLILFAG